MSTPADAQPRKRSEPRERLLATASQLFYAEGIGSIGINRIVAESKVTLATLYRHFPGKQDLVVAYLRAVHESIAAHTEEATSGVEGRDLVRTIGHGVTADIDRAGFRGCAFINAALEFEDPASDVRQVVAEHRQWYYDLIRDAFAGAGHQLPGNAARHFIMLRDGSMTAGTLDGTTSAKRTFKRGVEGLLLSIDLEPTAAHEDDED